MIIPMVIMAVSLGRSFDVESGTDKQQFIYDPKEIKKNEFAIPKNFVRSEYRFLESSSDVNNFLNVDGELSLKIKDGKFGVQGLGNYMMRTVNREQTVEMLIQVYHETETRTFPSYIPVRKDWQDKPARSIGTHYIRSITYGGRLLISYKLEAKKEEYMQQIKAAVNSNLQISGSIDGNATGNFEKFESEVSGKVRISIQAFATTGELDAPTNIEEALDLVDKYPSLVKKVNNGRGKPVQLEIISLHTIQRNFSDYQKNLALNGILDDATNKYDDIRFALSDFNEWSDNVEIPEEEDEYVDEFEITLKTANKAMRRAITNLDATKGAEQFDDAFKKYGSGGENLPNRYTRWLSALKHKIEKKPFSWHPYTKAVTHYVHWGNTTCSLPSSQPLFVGYAASSPTMGNGGNLQCLPGQEPALEVRNINAAISVSQIYGVDYELPEKTGHVFCSYCRLENATSVFTVTGRTECPAETKLEYDGYVMLSQNAGTVSTLICMDRNPADEIPDVQPDIYSSISALRPVWVQCPDCKYTNKKFVACVVCSR